MPLDFYAVIINIRIIFWPSVFVDRCRFQRVLLDEVYNHQFAISIIDAFVIYVIHQGQCLDHRQASRFAILFFLIQCITNSHTHTRLKISENVITKPYHFRLMEYYIVIYCCFVLDIINDFIFSPTINQRTINFS